MNLLLSFLLKIRLLHKVVAIDRVAMCVLTCKGCIVDNSTEKQSQSFQCLDMPPCLLVRQQATQRSMICICHIASDDFRTMLDRLSLSFPPLSSLALLVTNFNLKKSEVFIQFQ